MLGSIIGDIVGSRFESSASVPDGFDLMDAHCDFTDDTVCTVACIDAIVHGLPVADALRQWCARYPGRGYGSWFWSWVKTPGQGPYQSNGNGAAMRVAPAAYFARTSDEVLRMAEQLAVVTHDERTAVQGAQAVALLTRLALHGATTSELRVAARSRFGIELFESIASLASRQIFDLTAAVTVPIALRAATEATCFEDAIRLAVSVGGDTDTIACMAGTVAEARFGIPLWLREEALSRLPAEMIAVLEQAYRRLGCATVGLPASVLAAASEAGVPDVDEDLNVSADGLDTSMLIRLLKRIF